MRGAREKGGEAWFPRGETREKDGEGRFPDGGDSRERGGGRLPPWGRRAAPMRGARFPVGRACFPDAGDPPARRGCTLPRCGGLAPRSGMHASPVRGPRFSAGDERLPLEGQWPFPAELRRARVPARPESRSAPSRFNRGSSEITGRGVPGSACWTDNPMRFAIPLTSVLCLAACGGKVDGEPAPTDDGDSSVTPDSGGSDGGAYSVACEQNVPCGSLQAEPGGYFLLEGAYPGSDGAFLSCECVPESEVPECVASPSTKPGDCPGGCEPCGPSPELVATCSFSFATGLLISVNCSSQPADAATE